MAAEALLGPYPTRRSEWDYLLAPPLREDDDMWLLPDVGADEAAYDVDDRSDAASGSGSSFLESPGTASSSGSPQPLVLRDDGCSSEEGSTDGSDVAHDYGHWRVSANHAMAKPADLGAGLHVVQETAGAATVDLSVLAAANAFAAPRNTPPVVVEWAPTENGARPAVAHTAAPASGSDRGGRPPSRKRSREPESRIRTHTAGPVDSGTGECPICFSPEDGCGVSAQSRYAKYVPRGKARRDNHLAEYHAKWGYCGPRYCKSCAESFNSHLLRKAARTGRSKCSRQDPCDRCTQILGFFDLPPSEVFAAVDQGKRELSARKRQRQTQKQKQRQEQKQKQHTLAAPPPPVVSSREAEQRADGHLLPLQRRPSAVDTVLSLTAAVVVVSVSVLLWTGKPPTADSAQISSENTAHDDTPQWICGAVAAPLLKLSVSNDQREARCTGVSSQTTFPCDVNDCATGQLAIGQRMCRCDGCFQTGGRCAGWILEGYGTAAQESGCGLNPDFNLDRDPELYHWTPPGVALSECSAACGATE
eukprot:COSAG02_NODE_7993_length_2756_cov_1.432066_3_plen_532_part_01